MSATMKIKKLVIYGFGQHEEVTIALGPSMNVLFGHNEAGKTTIQQFILHVLFGFPPRNGPLLRYEPKAGGKYGGQIHLVDETYGRCIVERVRGKSAGDVTVYLENGETRGEETLRKILRQYDRASFESIFSFSLLQLQGFEKMDEQALSRTLLASGTTGVDHLLQVEAKMEKEMDLLFKKNGRNPVLNQQVNKLWKIEQKLQEEQKKIANYGPAIERLNEIEAQLHRLREKKKEIEGQAGELGIKRQLLPLHIKRNALKERLSKIEDVYFPTDGIQRYESIIEKRSETEAAIIRLQGEIEHTESILLEQVAEEKLVKYEQLMAKESDWHRALTAVSTLGNEQVQLRERRERLGARLGIQTEDEMIQLLQADVSIRKEEEMYELLERLQAYYQEMELIEREEKRIQEALAQIKEKDRYITPPSEKMMQEAVGWPSIRQQLAEAKAYLSFNHQQENNSKLMTMMILVLALLIAGYGLIGKQYSILFVGSLMTVIILLFMKRQTKDDRVEEMEKILAAYEGQEEEMEAVLRQVEAYEQQKIENEEEKINIEMDMRHAKEAYDELDEKIRQTEDLLHVFLSEYGIDGLPSAKIIPELFRLLREVLEVTRQIAHSEKESQQFKEAIQGYLTESEELFKQAIPQESLYEWIRKEYYILLQTIEKHKLQKKRLATLKAELEERKALYEVLDGQIRQLFEEANVKQAEDYYQAHTIEQEKASILEQIENLHLQLAVHGELEIDMSLTDGTLENRLNETKEKITALNREQTSLVEEKARLENETNALLSDETYRILQQQFEMERAQFIEQSKQWAAKKALASAIQQMMDELKEKRFPSVLKEAGRLFAKLTGERYETIVITEQGYFAVMTKEGIRYPIVELSQATKEQAYLSLRIALAMSVVKKAPFPIIMDDPFVHFDENRLSNMIEVLEQLTGHQLIYFTCQEEMKNRFKQAMTINVSAIGNK